MAEERGRQILDDEGRLFGIVNVVDALVVLLVLAVVIAGVALLWPSGEADTRYATIDLGEQPDFVAEQISAGDELTAQRIVEGDDGPAPQGPEGGLTITDVYLFDAGAQTSVVVRAELNGTAFEPDDPEADPVFEFTDEPLRAGQSYQLESPNYVASGNVESVAETGDTLAVRESEFVIETTVPPEVADEIALGDEFTTAGQTVAEITALEEFPRDDDHYMLVGMTADSIEISGSQFLGNTRLTVGANVAFDGDGYDFSGDVIRRGDDQVERGDSLVTIETTVSPSVASAMDDGDEFVLGDEAVATIESMELYPTGADGDRYAVLNLNLKTVDRAGTEQFAGQSVRLGNSIPFQTGEYTLTGDIIQRGDGDLAQTSEAVIIDTTVSTSVAESMAVGDEFVIGDETVATIESMEKYPTGSDGERYVLLGLDLKTVDQGDVIRFAGQSVRLGNTIPFATDDYTLSGEILQRGDSLAERSESAVVIETTVSSTLAESMGIGDEYVIDGETVATIEELELYPAGGDSRYALIGLDLKTVEQGDVEEFAGQSLRLGNSIPFATDDYTLNGAILQRGTATIDTEPRPFVIQTTVSTTVADDIEVGDEFQVAGAPVVTVESITRYATGNPDTRTVVLGVSANVREDDGAVLFGDDQIRVGDSLPLETGQYALSGEIVERGTLKEPGSQSTRTVTLKLENIPPERVDVLSTGMTETTQDVTTAELTHISTQPAEIILESEDGDIFLREHPTNKDVELTVELTVQELDDGTVRFRGDRLRIGQSTALDLGQLTVSGEIINIE